MTVPKRIRLKPLKEEKKRDLGFPILCLLFVVSRILDIGTLIVVYRVVGREFFNPRDNPLIQLISEIIRLIREVNLLALREISPPNNVLLYYFGPKGLLIAHAAFVLVILILALPIWQVGRRMMNNRKVRLEINLIKAALWLVTFASVLGALINIWSYQNTTP